MKCIYSIHFYYIMYKVNKTELISGKKKLLGTDTWSKTKSEKKKFPTLSQSYRNQVKDKQLYSPILNYIQFHKWQNTTRLQFDFHTDNGENKMKLTCTAHLYTGRFQYVWIGKYRFWIYQRTVFPRAALIESCKMTPQGVNTIHTRGCMLWAIMLTG